MLGKSGDRSSCQRNLVVNLLLRDKVRGRTSNEEDSSDCSLLGIADNVGGEEGKSDSVGDDEGEGPILSATTTDEDV